MNIKLIINAFLIILAIHLLLENLDFHMTVGNEMFSGENQEEGFTSQMQGPDDYDPKAELMAYIEDNDVHRIINRNEVVKPGNYYEVNEGNPVADSNVMDIRKFYQYNNAENSVGEVNAKPDQVGKQDPEFLQKNKWNYKNELPMNGGPVMGGVHGFDEIESQFAPFGDQQISGSCLKSVVDDDIRTGMGAPNRSSRMSGGNQF